MVKAGSGCFRDEIQDDEDVIAEKEKVILNSSKIGDKDSQVVISGLTKYFAEHKAVDSIYLTIPKGECFGLLGLCYEQHISVDNTRCSIDKFEWNFIGDKILFTTNLWLYKQNPINR